MQLNIAYPATGTQKMIDIDDDRKLCAPGFVFICICCVLVRKC